MNGNNNIEQLLKAFYDGDTTPEEEALLLEFFNSNNLDEKWQTERDMFNVLYDFSLPDGISERLEKVINEHIAESVKDKHLTKTANDDNETHNNNEPLYPETRNDILNKKAPMLQKTRKLFINISSAAAVILLCIGLFFTFEKSTKSHTIADTYTNPEEAAIVAEQMLTLVSTKLNKGFSPLEKIKESIDKTSGLLNESLNINE